MIAATAHSRRPMASSRARLPLPQDRLTVPARPSASTAFHRRLSRFQASRYVACFLCLLPCGIAHAQDFQTIAPKQPGAHAAPALPTPAPPPVSNATTQLLARLDGLRLIDAAAKLARGGVHATGIEIRDLPLLDQPALRAQLTPFLGQPLKVADLDRIAAVIIHWYRAHDRPLVDVRFPEQDVSGSAVQGVVTEFRLGDLKVRGARHFAPKEILGELAATQGDLVDFGVLQRDLNQLDRNPYREVQVAFLPAKEAGYTDLDLTVHDRRPWRVYVGADNSGLPVTDRNRLQLGFSWGDAFGLGGQLGYQLSTSPDLFGARDRGPDLSHSPRFLAHAATYSAPLAPGTMLDLFGALAEQTPDLGPFFGQTGHSGQASLRLRKALPIRHGLATEFEAGFDYKRTDNNLAFGGTQIFVNVTEIFQGLVGASFTWSGAAGQTVVHPQLFFAPGGVSPANDTAAFRASGVNGASAAYAYGRVDVSHLGPIARSLIWYARVTGQLASTDLLPSEQLGLGGTDSVRGYEQRAASGSDGVMASAELRFGPFPLLGSHAGGAGDRMQLLAFWDGGATWSHRPQSAASNHATLQSVGVGARYSLRENIDLRADWGFQLTRAPGESRRGNRAVAAITFAL